MRYFITFTCYGAHLHGDEPGSVDRSHNVPGSRLVEPNPERAAVKREQMDQAPYLLDQSRRATVLGAIREVCLHRGGGLWAAHVRTNHVHAVVEAEVRPESQQRVRGHPHYSQASCPRAPSCGLLVSVMNAFKAYASRRLNRLGIDHVDRKRWARHGSTRWLWSDDDVRAAIRYVVDGQGQPMEVYRAEPA